MLTIESNLTPEITRRAHTAGGTEVSRMKAPLFAVGWIDLLGGAMEAK